MAGNAERTYLMIKPDGVQRGLAGKIIMRFEERGYKLVSAATHGANPALPAARRSPLAARRPSARVRASTHVDGERRAAASIVAATLLLRRCAGAAYSHFCEKAADGARALVTRRSR